MIQRKPYLLTAFLCATVAFAACGKGHEAPLVETEKSQAQSLEKAKDNNEKPLIVLNKITEGVWLHTSSQDIPGYGLVPANGLAVKDGDSLTLVNTAWGELATVELSEKLKEETGLDIGKLIVVHFHPDSLAGVDWLEERGVEVFAHPDTPKLSAQRGTPIPNTSVKALGTLGARVKVGPVEVSYPGPAHTEDNLMVYVTEPKILFGGCAVRPGNSSTMGNIADANMEKWPTSLQWAKETYPDTKMTIPSHGNPAAGITLIDHSLELLEKAGKAASQK